MKAKKPVYLRWWYLALAALFVISGLSYLGQDVTTGLITTLIGIAMFALTFYKKKTTPKTAPVRTSGLPFSFQAVGVYYHKYELISVASLGRGFDYPDEKFIEKNGEGKTVYQYYFNNCVGALVPEPENPHDPNAIKVTLDGACVGHVPAELTGKVAALLAQNPTVKVNVRGGPRKYVKDGVVYKSPGDFTVYVDMTE